MDLGLKIRIARRLENLTQGQLGEKIGVTGAAVGNWERGGSIEDENLEKLRQVIPLDTISDDMVSAVGAATREKPRLSKAFLSHRSGDPETEAAVTALRNQIAHGHFVSSKIEGTGRARKGHELSQFLPENLRDNIEIQVTLGGFPYRFEYVSSKLFVKCLSVPFLDAVPPNIMVSPSTVLSLWHLACARRYVAGPHLSPLYPRCLLILIGPSVAGQSRSLQKRMTEAQLFGVEIEVAPSIEAAATLIESIESGNAPPRQSPMQDLYDDFDEI